MIIKCPSCERRFELQRRPPMMFKCPKCSFTAPFSTVMNESKSPSNDIKTYDDTISMHNINKQPLLNQQSDPTQFVPGLQGTGYVPDKTKVVPELQQRTIAVPDLQQPKPTGTQGVLQVSFNGSNYATIKLPQGPTYYLGRNSADSTAKIKLAPDKTMSRVHAGMRTKIINGKIEFQITSIKDTNPVYVNGIAVPQGKAVTLKSGDNIVMGNTTIVFKKM